MRELFFGDSEYTLKMHIMTAYSDTGNLSEEHILYNTTHTKVRSCIDRVYSQIPTFEVS